MKISYGDKELLDTQTFLTFGPGETKIVIGDENEYLNLVLDFSEDKENEKKQIFEIVPIDDTSLKMRLTNWCNVLGTGFLNPIEVGSFNKRKLYFLLYVRKAGGKGDIWEVTFSAYLGEEVQDGEN